MQYLSQKAWDRIKDSLPGSSGHVGDNGKNNRLFLEAVIWILRTGAPWRDLPERYGKWNTNYTRFSRWAKKGIWNKIFEKLKDDKSIKSLMIDSSIIRSHQHAAGAKGGRKRNI